MIKQKMEMVGTGIAIFIIAGLIIVAFSMNRLVNGKEIFELWLMLLIIGNCFLFVGLYHLYPLRKKIKERFEEVFL